MILLNSKKSDDELFHLILFENHCVSDGRSGFILINDFLTLVSSSNLLEISEPLNTEILPLIGELIPHPYGILFGTISWIGKQIFKRELRQMTQPRIPVKVTFLNDCESTRFQSQRYKIKFLFASSSTNLYSKLHQQCRLYEVTLNGPLVACLLLAIHQYFPHGNNNNLKSFGIGIPFDMRSRLPESPLTSSSVGFFVGVGEVKLKRTLSIRSTRFWSLVDKCVRLTRNQLKRDGIPLMMNIFADILRNERNYTRFSRLIPEGRQSEFAFSNIGKYPFSCEYNHDEIRLQGIHVINNASVYRNSTGIYVTCVGDGQLDFSMAHEMESDRKGKDSLNYYLRLVEVCADDARCKTETNLQQLLNMVEL